MKYKAERIQEYWVDDDPSSFFWPLLEESLFMKNVRDYINSKIEEITE